MNTQRPNTILRNGFFLIVVLLGLVACGGGGGGNLTFDYNGTGKAPADLVPGSGEYVPVIVSDGLEDIEVSAAHPSFPNKEFTWSGALVKAKSFSLSYTGKIDSAGVISNYTVSTLNTLSDNSLGSVSMASGGRPVYSVSSSPTKLCGYKTPEGWGKYHVNYGTNFDKYLSNEAIIKAGFDNVCDTADDVVDDIRLGVFLNPKNGQIVDLFQDGSAFFDGPRSFSDVPGTYLKGTIYRSVGDLYKIILNADNAVLFEDARGLWLAKPEYRTDLSYWDSISVAQIRLSTNWKAIGYDDSGLYVYKNSSTLIGSGNWEIIKIDLATGVGNSLANGGGSLQPVFGDQQIWASVAVVSSVSTKIINKKDGKITNLSGSSTNSIILPIAAGGGRVINYVARAGFAGFEIYNEDNLSQPYRTISNSYISVMPMVGPLSIKKTPSTGIIYVQQNLITSSSSHAGGKLFSYDPVSDQIVEYGTLASAPIGGVNAAVGLASSNPTLFKTFVLQGVNASQTAVAVGSKKYSFVFGQPNSLTELTGRVQLNE